MFEIDKQEARRILIEELDYQSEIADFYLDHFPALDDRLAEAVSTWMESREVPDVEVNGLSIQQIMDVHGSHFLSAIRGLNDLLTRELSQDERNALIAFLGAPLLRASLDKRGAA